MINPRKYFWIFTLCASGFGIFLLVRLNFWMAFVLWLPVLITYIIAVAWVVDSIIESSKFSKKKYMWLVSGLIAPVFAGFIWSTVVIELKGLLWPAIILMLETMIVTQVAIILMLKKTQTASRGQ